MFLVDKISHINLIPFKRINIKSDRSPNEIMEALTNLVSKPDWNISIPKVINNRILEGKVTHTSFVIVMGRYGLTFGMTSLLPIMKGRVEKNGVSSGSLVSIIIRPFKTGILILTFFYLLGILGIYFSIRKDLTEVFTVCCILICVTYFSLISKYNKEFRLYADLIKKIF